MDIVTNSESVVTPAPRKPLPRRRNGQEQACEPCRKAKVKCDHTLPTCLKCVRRKDPSKCVYLPAPMSQSKTPQSSERSSTSAPPISSPIDLSPRPIGLVIDTLRTPSSHSLRPAQEPSISTRAAAPDNASGFLLSTGFPAIVKDNFSENLASESAVESTDMVERPHHSISEAHNMTSTGVWILRQFPDRQTCDILMQRYSETIECSFHIPTILHIVSSIWTTFGHHLAEPRSLHNLELVIQEIVQNSRKPLKEPADYQEWLDTFSGPNLRWEALGIAFISLAFSCVCSPRDTLKFQQGSKKFTKSLSMELKGCSEAIIGILRKHETINLLVVVLLVKDLHLGTLIHGDTSFSVWREHGDLVGALTALNLHQDDDTCSTDDPETINIPQEMRRRLFASVFIFDKCLALFNGRPPILSRRYCSCPLPLDLPDDAFIYGKEHLIREVKQLDDMGWCRKEDGTIHDMTGMRVSVLFCMILDEILEMLIGNRAQYSDERLNNLKLRTDQIYRSIPPHLHFLHADLHSPSAPCIQSDRLHWAALSGRLDYLRMTFLMERLATERSSISQNQSRQKLIDISRDMLENTVYLWLQRDRFHDRLHDYDYMLMCYGMPSAGILCVELLRSIKRHGKEGEEERNKIRLPRSEVVQNLSLLVGFLDWVRPSAGNYKLCGRMRQIIQRILDMVLDPSPSSPSADTPNKRQRIEEHRVSQANTVSEIRQGNGFIQQGVMEKPADSQPENRDHEANYATVDLPGALKQYHGQHQTQSGFGTGMGFSGGGAGLTAGSNGMSNEGFASFLDEGLENLDWLNEVDWTRGPWIDLN